jgi:Fe-S-cluster containining protein
VANYEIDYSEVIGKKVECPPECGLCCLCQPEVLPLERAFFRENHPDKLVKSRGPDPYFALSLKKGRGSCSFLDNRRCKVYDHRTTYCRQFPFHFYVSDRVKVELDLSCRGVWYNTGSDALIEAKGLAEAADKRLQSAIKEASAVYREFYANCREAGVMADPSVLRMSVSENITNFTDLAYLGNVMDMSLEEPEMALSAVQRDLRFEMEEMEEAARSAALESMSSDDPVNLPVYCDKDWNWNMFMATEGQIEWMVLDDEGDIHHKGYADPAKIPLKPLEAGGAELLGKYIAVLNNRDSFIGNVFSMMDETGYEDAMANAYYGAMSSTILDLLWRASILDHFMGTGMGEDGIREAIIFYDMDRLDAPTIGAFV